MIRIISLLLALGLCASGVPAQTPVKKTFALDYTIELLPKQDQARIHIALGKGSERVTRISLKFDAKPLQRFHRQRRKVCAGQYRQGGLDASRCRFDLELSGAHYAPAR
ncbi:MAG: hypothetical protein IPH50_09670 [Rhodanobacteraceae bacterium]|nr:hypothetical protein [Rhodanobacteraceae bacterium]